MTNHKILWNAITHHRFLPGHPCSMTQRKNPTIATMATMCHPFNAISANILLLSLEAVVGVNTPIVWSARRLARQTFV
jgi:hypothetical protein